MGPQSVHLPRVWLDAQLAPRHQQQTCGSFLTSFTNHSFSTLCVREIFACSPRQSDRHFEHLAVCPVSSRHGLRDNIDGRWSGGQRCIVVSVRTPTNAMFPETVHSPCGQILDGPPPHQPTFPKCVQPVRPNQIANHQRSTITPPANRPLTPSVT